MKGFSRGAAIIALVVLVPGFFWSISRATKTFFSVDRFAFQFSGQFGQDQKKIIQQFFKNDLIFPFRDSIKKIKQTFPSIKSVDLFHNARGTVAAHIESVQPILRVNEDLVLSDEGLVLQRKLFDTDLVRQLERLDFFDVASVLSGIQGEDFDIECLGALPKTFTETIKSIPQFLFKKYLILCKDKSSWWLKDRSQKKFHILFNGEKIPNEPMINSCNKLKDLLISRGMFTKKRARNWFADVRFEDQIILFAKTGGR